MKLLGLVLQNKKGQNLIVACSASMLSHDCILYSNLIYNKILDNYRRRLKIQRVIFLKQALLCVISITKDYMFYTFVQKSDLSIASDCIRKFTDFFNGSGRIFGSNNSSTIRLEIINRKIVEFMSIMEQFLYCRQLNIKQYLPMLEQIYSQKKTIDLEILNKFPHIINEIDKKIMLETQILSLKVQSMKLNKRIKSIQISQQIMIRTQDQLDLLDIDPQKQNYIHLYRKSILTMITCGKRKPLKTFLNSIGQQNSQSYSNIQFRANNRIVGSKIEKIIQPISQHEQQQQQQQQQNVQTKSINLPQNFSFVDYQSQSTTVDENNIVKNVKLRIAQKLQLHLRNGKIKQVFQFGQIMIECKIFVKGCIKLIDNKNRWHDKKILNWRLSPNSIERQFISQNILKFSMQGCNKSKPILDYIILKNSFTPQKIPLLFVYTMQNHKNYIQFILKYKMNQKWNQKLQDIDISVYLNKKFMVRDCKTVPIAHSLKDNKITWKSKQMCPKSSNSKGKIILTFGEVNVTANSIIHEIVLTMKTNTNLLNGLNAQLTQGNFIDNTAKKILIINYKILPNIIN